MAKKVYGESFPQDLEMWLQGFLPIQTQEH